MKSAVKSPTVFLLLLVAVASGARAAFQLPAPEKLVLKNGLPVYFLKNSDLPVVSFRMWIRGAGNAFEPPELEGVAGLTADLLLKGTAKMDADAIASAIDSMGARLDISASDEYTSVSAESLSERFPALMEIAADCLENPAFSEDEFAKETKTDLDSLKAARDNPAAAVRLFFEKAYFGTHPLGHLSSGTESSLKRITRADVRGHYQLYFRPERATAAVAGDIEKTALLETLNRTLGAWSSAGAAAPASSLPPPPAPKGKKLVFVDKPDATQAYWILGSPGYPVGDKTTPSAVVMNTLFGGRFTSWLSTELRIKRGLTYGASSGFQSWAAGGLFTASSYTRNEKIGEMLDIVFDLLAKVRKEGFSPEEVESARNYILGQFPPTLETNAAKANTYLRLLYYGLGFDYYGKYLAAIQGVSLQDTKAAALRLIPQSDFVLVVVGKGAEIKKQLEKYGTWQEKKIGDPDF